MVGSPGVSPHHRAVTDVVKAILELLAGDVRSIRLVILHRVLFL